MRSWIVVLVFALGACSKDQPSGPAVVPGAPAGDVLEVTGAVTAKRGGEMRGLAVGDEVSGDDVIGTGAEASVLIQLRHNGVKWSLKGGRDRKLSDTPAWRAPARGHDHDGVGDPSTAAGRHAEREAADTTVSNTAPVPVPETHAAEPAAAIAAPSAPALNLGNTIEGELTHPELEAAMAAQRDALVPCSTGRGHRAVSFTVGADGVPTEIRVEDGTLEVDVACVDRVFAGLRLPAHATPSKVTVMINAE